MSLAYDTLATLAFEFSRLRRAAGLAQILRDAGTPVAEPVPTLETTQTTHPVGLTWADTLELNKLDP